MTANHNLLYTSMKTHLYLLFTVGKTFWVRSRPRLIHLLQNITKVYYRLHSMAKGHLNKIGKKTQGWNYHNMKAYGFGDHHKRKLKSHISYLDSHNFQITITWHCSHLETLLLSKYCHFLTPKTASIIYEWPLRRFWSERGILVFVNNDSQYFSCCGSFGLGFFQFY